MKKKIVKSAVAIGVLLVLSMTSVFGGTMTIPENTCTEDLNWTAITNITLDPNDTTDYERDHVQAYGPTNTPYGKFRVDAWVVGDSITWRPVFATENPLYNVHMVIPLEGNGTFNLYTGTNQDISVRNPAYQQLVDNRFPKAAEGLDYRIEGNNLIIDVEFMPALSSFDIEIKTKIKTDASLVDQTTGNITYTGTAELTAKRHIDCPNQETQFGDVSTKPCELHWLGEAFIDKLSEDYSNVNYLYKVKDSIFPESKGMS